MKIDTVVKPGEQAHSEGATDRDEYKMGWYATIIDKYIMGEPIEKEFNIKGISVILRAPKVSVINEIYRDISRSSTDGYVDLQIESSSNLMSAYVRKYKDRDMLDELGDKYDTVEGKRIIREYLDNELIEPVRDVLIEKVYEFYSDINKAFADDALDFS